MVGPKEVRKGGSTDVLEEGGWGFGGGCCAVVRLWNMPEVQ